MPKKVVKISKKGREFTHGKAQSVSYSALGEEHEWIANKSQERHRGIPSRWFSDHIRALMDQEKFAAANPTE